MVDRRDPQTAVPGTNTEPSTDLTSLTSHFTIWNRYFHIGALNGNDHSIFPGRTSKFLPPRAAGDGEIHLPPAELPGGGGPEATVRPDGVQPAKAQTGRRRHAGGARPSQADAPFRRRGVGEGVLPSGRLAPRDDTGRRREPGPGRDFPFLRRPSPQGRD